MPRYFFNVHDGGSSSDDEDGYELASPDEARAEAIKTAGEMIREDGRKFWPNSTWTMIVVDEAGAVACTLKFSAAS